MRRVVGFIMVLVGTAMLICGVVIWASMFEKAWEQGGMATTGVFYFLLFGGGLGLIVLGGVMLKRRRFLEPYEGLHFKDTDRED